MNIIWIMCNEINSVLTLYRRTAPESDLSICSVHSGWYCPGFPYIRLGSCGPGTNLARRPCGCLPRTSSILIISSLRASALPFFLRTSSTVLLWAPVHWWSLAILASIFTWSANVKLFTHLFLTFAECQTCFSVSAYVKANYPRRLLTSKQSINVLRCLLVLLSGMSSVIPPNVLIFDASIKLLTTYHSSRFACTVLPLCPRTDWSRSSEIIWPWPSKCQIGKVSMRSPKR